MSVYHVRVSQPCIAAVYRSSASARLWRRVQPPLPGLRGSEPLVRRRATLFVVTFFIKYEARRRWHTVDGAQGTTQGAVDSPSRLSRSL